MIIFMVTFKIPVPVLCHWPRRVYFKYVTLHLRKIRLNIILYTHARTHKWHVSLTTLCYKTKTVGSVKLNRGSILS